MKASQSWEQGGDLPREGYTIHLQNIIITLYLHLYFYLYLYAICLHIIIIIIGIVKVVFVIRRKGMSGLTMR